MKPADNEILIHISKGPDRLSRTAFEAYWLDNYLPPSGVRGQCFFMNLDEFKK